MPILYIYQNELIRFHMNMFLNLFPRKLKEKKEVSITYQIGWWAFQELLEIHTLDVSIVKSHLNVLNSKSLIRYTITGVLHKRAGGMPYIRAVHHNEEVLQSKNVFAETADRTLDARIQITPVVGIKNTKEQYYKDVPFTFTNQYVITSLHWGDNFIDFSCGAIHKEICLQQRK